jgi:hypothetical protein
MCEVVFFRGLKMMLKTGSCPTLTKTILLCVLILLIQTDVWALVNIFWIVSLEWSAVICYHQKLILLIQTGLWALGNIFWFLSIEWSAVICYHQKLILLILTGLWALGNIFWIECIEWSAVICYHQPLTIILTRTLSWDQCHLQWI